MKKIVLAAVLLSTATSAVAEWKYGETVDAMTDQKRARAFAPSETGAIGVKCDTPGADSLYIHFVANEYLGGRGGRSGFRELLYRFDDDQPVGGTWTYDARNAILTDDDKVWAFVRRLETAKKLSIRASTYEYKTVDATIDVSGAAPEIAKVVAACQAVRR